MFRHATRQRPARAARLRLEKIRDLTLLCRHPANRLPWLCGGKGRYGVHRPSFMAGQCPVMRYNRDLMMAILWGRMPYLTPLLNAEIIPLEDAVAAYETFHEGSPKKYVIDPHDTIGLTAAA